jgi:hypothetical protein
MRRRIRKQVPRWDLERSSSSLALTVEKCQQFLNTSASRDFRQGQKIGRTLDYCYQPKSGKEPRQVFAKGFNEAT